MGVRPPAGGRDQECCGRDKRGSQQRHRVRLQLRAWEDSVAFGRSGGAGMGC